MNLQIRLVQLDGKIPNIALMKLAHWHRTHGDQVHLARQPQPDLFEPRNYDVVYGSAIFDSSEHLCQRLLDQYPDAILGGTGAPEPAYSTVEQAIRQSPYERYDYSIYPEYPWSIGFTQRGCRLQCAFCVVPDKEGQPYVTNRILDIWRPGTPKNVLLLDNDFFGQPAEAWRARVRELNQNHFRVSINQGINVRLLTEETARAVASLRYYDYKFQTRRLYTAWDNIGHERVFFRGLDKLTAAGVPPHRVMVYMLIGFDPEETMERLLYRYQRIRDSGCLPYPMVYDRTNRTLKGFQRWVVMRYHTFVPWEDYRKNEHLPTYEDSQQTTLPPATRPAQRQAPHKPGAPLLRGTRYVRFIEAGMKQPPAIPKGAAAPTARSWPEP